MLILPGDMSQVIDMNDFHAGTCFKHYKTSKHGTSLRSMSRIWLPCV